MIKLHNIKKSYKNIELFDNLNATFNMGSKILIKGINGAGKSVLLKILVGFSKPDSGKVIIDDKELHRDFDFLPNVGASINSPEFVGGLTGLENLMILAKIKNIASEKDIKMLAKKLYFEKDLNKKYKTYSLGMKQKLRIIQALMDRPTYLILDEPFDALDQKSCESLSKLLNEYVTEDKMLIYTTHSKEFESLSDEVYTIVDYQLIKE